MGKKGKRTRQRIVMQVIRKDIKYKQSLPLKLFCIGDMHKGTIHCAEKALGEKVYEIKETPNALWVGMGDYAEFITPSDPRWDGGSIADWVDKEDIGYSQEQAVINMLAPIKNKCVGMLCGNHELSIFKHSHQNVHKHIVDALGVPNLGYSAFVHFNFARENSQEKHLIKGCFSHGTGNAITEGAKINNLMRFMKSFDADFYAYGHIHDYISKSYTRLYTNNKGRIEGRVVTGATTGSWFRTYTQGTCVSYGEMKMLPPNELCCAMFTIKIGEGKFDIEVEKSA